MTPSSQIGDTAIGIGNQVSFESRSFAHALERLGFRIIFF